MKKIVIADHHPVTRKGITCLLKKDANFLVVGKANNGNELYAKLESENPDILIMEIDMPQINGINALRGIKSKFPDLRVLIFSTHPEEI
jgi:DNA-binding NarL/FixJ family response regulator